MDYIELFAGIGGFRHGLENCGHSGRTSREGQLSAEGTSACPNRGEGDSGQPKPSPILHGGETDTDSRNSTNNQGGTSQYSQRAFRCVWSNDFDKYACSVYRYHYGEIHEGDIRTVDPATIPDHDLIVGGFPCQSFSVAGARGGFSDTRGTLFAEICRIARAKRPSYLFLENVKGLLSAPYTISPEEWTEDDFDPDTGEPTAKAEKKHKAIPGTKGWVFLTILHSLWELGYDCQWQLLNSKYHGVPQNRERVFIIGHLRTKSRPQIFPIGEIGELRSETSTKIATALQIRQMQKHGNFVVSRTLQATYGKDGEDILIEQPIVGALSGGGHSGGLHSQMTMIHTAYPGEVREYSETSPTISTPSGGGHLPMVAQALQTDGQLRSGTSWGTDKPQSARSIRRLTPTECERLQSFPDNWTKYGIDKNGKQFEVSDTQRYKMCGNAVTTNVIRDIGEAFMQAVQNVVK